MKIFLSARYSRRDEMRVMRERLGIDGHHVVSRWLDTQWERRDDSGSSAAPADYRAHHAAVDLADVLVCDCLIAFTEEPRTPTRGGRHVELGAALATGKRIFVVGHREHIFCHHPRVEFYKTVEPVFVLLRHGEPEVG